MSNRLYIRTGTAIVEIGRIAKSAKNRYFLSNYFSADEIRFFVSRKLSPALIAENYCVKIAFAKAIGTGFRIVKARDIAVLRDRLGSPFIITSGNAKLMEQREGFEVNISVDHCKHYATATVIITR